MRRGVFRNFSFLNKIFLLTFVNLFLLKLNLAPTYHKTHQGTGAYCPKISSTSKTLAQMHLESDIKDWDNKTIFIKDLTRAGAGEQGKPVTLAKKDMEKIIAAYRIYGYNTVASAHIPLDRSLPDVRHPLCNATTYLKTLPAASIIIVFHNEHWSVVVRAVLSVTNRSPPELIKEVILVDDGSTVKDIAILRQYFKAHVPIVHMLHMNKQLGLIAARLAGTKAARGQILIFLHAQVEANYNWLPPLLEPIVKNSKACVCPQIDRVKYSTFEYGANDDSSRKIFDWNFKYHRVPVLREEWIHLPNPFKDPVMMHGMFAIRKDHFLRLGGYDEKFNVWGGEQFELSFKIWMCGGQIQNAPCSRFGYIFPAPEKNDYNNKVYFHRNLKRVAEVWMDEYKEYLYARDPIYHDIDAGNLTNQKVLRLKLRCKSFKWYLEHVAVELLKTFPTDMPVTYASGAIRNDVFNNLCLDAIDFSREGPISLYECSVDLDHPDRKQYWLLTYKNELRIIDMQYCLDSYDSGPAARVYLIHCHGTGGNQFWEYDAAKKWLKHKDGSKCLEAGSDRRAVYVNQCNAENLRQRWTFGIISDIRTTKKSGYSKKVSDNQNYKS